MHMTRLISLIRWSRNSIGKTSRKGGLQGGKETMMSIDEIRATLPHRYPFLLVDRIRELELGRRIVGIKNVTINEPFFQGHFPDRPIMPGVLLLEGMSQTAGVICALARGDPGPPRNVF